MWEAKRCVLATMPRKTIFRHIEVDSLFVEAYIYMIQSDDLRRVPRNHLILNSQGQPFLCHVPYPVNPAPSPAKVTLAVTEEQRKEERLKGLERGLTLLEPLKERGCLYQVCLSPYLPFNLCHPY